MFHQSFASYSSVYAANEMGVSNRFPESGFGCGLRYLEFSFGAALRLLYDDQTLNGQVVDYESSQVLRARADANDTQHVFLLYTRDGRVTAMPRLGE